MSGKKKTTGTVNKDVKESKPWEEAHHIASQLKEQFATADRGELDQANQWGEGLNQLRAWYDAARKDKDAPAEFAAMKWGKWCEKYTGKAYRTCRLYQQIRDGWEMVKDCKSIREARNVLQVKKGGKVRTPNVPELSDEDRQALTVALHRAGIKAIPDAVLAAVVSAGWKVSRAKKADTSYTPATVKPEALEAPVIVA